MPIMLHEDGVAIDCPAKLNLTLAVGAPRGDGLHPIASVMVALAFGDALYINPLNEGPSRFIRAWDPDEYDLELDPDEPPIQPVDWPIEKDLIYRAHALMQEEAGFDLPVECGLDKRIPAGAGLGGGSSDAAGMLVGLRELFELDISDARLIALGQSLGADVGFLVHALLGRRAAVVTGIGEIIEPIDSLPAFEVVLICPDGQCPTSEVYKQFDLIGPSASADDLAGCAAKWLRGFMLHAFRNDLTAAAENVCPAIVTAKSLLAPLGIAPELTGSGSALFVLADSADQASDLAANIRQAGLTAVATRYEPGGGDLKSPM